MPKSNKIRNILKQISENISKVQSGTQDRWTVEYQGYGHYTGRKVSHEEYLEYEKQKTIDEASDKKAYNSFLKYQKRRQRRFYWAIKEFEDFIAQHPYGSKEDFMSFRASNRIRKALVDDH